LPNEMSAIILVNLTPSAGGQRDERRRKARPPKSCTTPLKLVRWGPRCSSNSRGSHIPLRSECFGVPRPSLEGPVVRSPCQIGICPAMTPAGPERADKQILARGPPPLPHRGTSGLHAGISPRNRNKRPPIRPFHAVGRFPSLRARPYSLAPLEPLEYRCGRFLSVDPPPQKKKRRAAPPVPSTISGIAVIGIRYRKTRFSRWWGTNKRGAIVLRQKFGHAGRVDTRLGQAWRPWSYRQFNLALVPLHLSRKAAERGFSLAGGFPWGEDTHAFPRRTQARPPVSRLASTSTANKTTKGRAANYMFSRALPPVSNVGGLISGKVPATDEPKS